jgi:hypothetical protein
MQRPHVRTLHFPNALMRYHDADTSVNPSIGSRSSALVRRNSPILLWHDMLDLYADLHAVLITAQDAGYEAITSNSRKKRKTVQSIIISKSWKRTDHVSSR